jgi:putative endonuclease
MLFSESHHCYYIGQTQDIQQRIIRHNKGIEKATAPYLPWKIVCLIEKDSRSAAMILEKKLKNLNTEKLKKFILKYT